MLQTFQSLKTASEIKQVASYECQLPSEHPLVELNHPEKANFCKTIALAQLHLSNGR
jgi:hypothetical protein